MTEQILLVDDEPAILQGYQRIHREFQIDTAVGSVEALAKISAQPYAVVVSDMRMPEMDGVQLLARIKLSSPDTVRVMLTGNADIETAMDAVNEGNIFRFLSKPCNKETLGKALEAALVQYRLITAEKNLLEQTLRGSIRVLTEVLSLVNPAAFGRAERIRKYVTFVVTKLGLENPWQFEIAAMMSQLGCVTLHPDTIDAIYAGQAVSAEERARFETHPRVGEDLLCNIPRMAPIAWMIAHQCEVPRYEQQPPSGTSESIRVGGDILRASLRFDELLQRNTDKAVAILDVQARWKHMDRRICEALGEVQAEASQNLIRNCALENLVPGMVLNEEVRAQNGLLIVARGQEVTTPLIVRLRNFFAKNAIRGSVSVTVPKVAAAAAGGPKMEGKN